MSGALPSHLEQLRALLVAAGQAVEQAEALVGQFNDRVSRLAQDGRVPRGVFLGRTIASPWGTEATPGESGQVVQAVLLVPEGLGVSRFGAEAYDAYAQGSGGLEQEVRLTFVPFARCQPGEKALFYSEMGFLVDQFLASAVRASNTTARE
jgi:hypothetical protein